jgi:uncharacterized protein YkwD
MSVQNKIVITFCSFCAICSLTATAASAAPTPDEQALLAEMNRVRAAHGAQPLRIDVRLERAARAQTSDMLRRGYFAHGDFLRRLLGFGARGPARGENLAWGIGSYSTPGAIVAGWLASPPHRANLLRRGFRRVGLGRLIGPFAGRGGAAVVTADFAGR